MLNFRSIGVLLTLLSSLCLGTHSAAQERNTSAALVRSVNLAPGDCALFVWAGYPSRLLYISQASEEAAYSAQEGMTRYALKLKRGADKFDQYASQDFLNGSGEGAELRLSDPADKSKFVLYKSGTITLPSPDGWLRIESAQAVSACNDTGADTAVEVDQTAGRFHMPAWLETPTQLAETATRQVVELEIPVRAQVLPATAITSPPQLIVEAPIVESTPVERPTEMEPSLEAALPTPVAETEPIAYTADPVAAPVIDLSVLHTVQLGAFPSAARAQQGWTELQQETDYLEGKQSIVQLADIEGLGALYRLRITGFSERGTAINFCERLKSDGVDCYVPYLK